MMLTDVSLKLEIVKHTTRMSSFKIFVPFVLNLINNYNCPITLDNYIKTIVDILDEQWIRLDCKFSLHDTFYHVHIDD